MSQTGPVNPPYDPVDPPNDPANDPFDTPPRDQFDAAGEVPPAGGATAGAVVPPPPAAAQGTVASGSQQGFESQGFGSQGSGSSTAETARGQASEVKDTTKEAGKQVVQETREQAGHVAAEARNRAGDLLRQGTNEIKSQAGQQQQRLAQSVHSLAKELGQMASSSDQSGPMSGLVQQASRRTGEIAHWLENHEPTDILDGLRSFARRRPGTFLLGAAAAGVLTGRLSRGLADNSKASQSPAAESGYIDQPGVGVPTATLPPSSEPTPVATEPPFNDPMLTGGTTPGHAAGYHAPTEPTGLPPTQGRRVNDE